MTAARPVIVSRWEIQLFGRVGAKNGGQVISNLRSEAVATLLARLATSEQPLLRGRLASQLWPDISDKAALNRLRQALHALRTMLEPPGAARGSVLSLGGERVGLNPAAYDSDVRRFMARVLEGDTDAAGREYRGDFMPGFYGDWVETTRKHLREQFANLRSVTRGRGLTTSNHFSSNGRHPDPSKAAAPTRYVITYETTFVGRAAETEELLGLVSTKPLVTVRGFAGSGKSRLCNEVARLTEDFETVAFIPMSDCADFDQALHQIRLALQVSPSDRSPLEQISRHLVGRRVLLIFDNFEQLVGDAGDRLLTGLRQSLPNLHVMLTSRKATRRADEVEFVLAPLEIPVAVGGLIEASRIPSVVLFCDRARKARAEFRLHSRNWRAVVELCIALEGVPLAIEITASRIRSCTANQAHEALVQGATVLEITGKRQSNIGRHSSLAAAIDWSWRLLSPEQQRALADLACFRGAWTEAAATSVCANRQCAQHLTSLVANSLIHQDGVGDKTRFSMLQSIREFIRERVSPGQALLARERHRAYYLALVTSRDTQIQAFTEDDLSNLAQALSSAVSDRDWAIGIALTWALTDHWATNGIEPEVTKSLKQLATCDYPVEGRYRAMNALARALPRTGNFKEAAEFAEMALGAAGDRFEQHADAVLAKANIEWLWNRDPDASLAPAREALRIADLTERSDLRARARILLGAVVLSGANGATEAQALFDQAESLYSDGGNSLGVVAVCPGKVSCLLEMGRHEEAIDLALTGANRAAQSGQVNVQLMLYTRLSVAYEALEMFTDAVDTCRHQLRLARQNGLVYDIGFALWNQCAPLTHLHHPLAATLTAFAQAYWSTHFRPLNESDQKQLAGLRRLIAKRIGHARLEAQWNRGAGLAERDGLDLACDMNPLV